MRSAAWACLLLLLGTWGVQAQTSISDINSNPGSFIDQTVTIEGEVARHVDSGDDDTDTQNYILQGEDEEEIRVKTSDDPPSVGARYSVQGTISVNPFSRDPVLSETDRTQMTASEETDSSSTLQEGLEGIVVFLIGGLFILVVIVIGYFAYASQEDEAPVEAASPAGDGVAESAEASSDLASTELGADDGEPDTGFPEPSEQRIKSESSSSEDPEEDSSGPETLKFKAPPKTMKFVPGRLVIAAGPDQGKEFRIAGRPTPDGNIVTIGRAEVEGEKAFAHIQLGDTYRTVSRMQAEIIQQDDVILLKNTSETNPTMVNGEHVPTGESVELSDGDMIRMGELMLRYERD